MSLLDNAPYLAPWYISKNKPKLLRSDELLYWRFLERSNNNYVGVTLLEGLDKSCFALIGIHTYILPASDGLSFLIWNRTLEKTTGLPVLNIYYYQTKDLQVFVNRGASITLMKKHDHHFVFSANPTKSIRVEINPAEEAIEFDFPDEFRKFGNFIVIAELPNLYPSGAGTDWHNTTLLDFQVSHGRIVNYPQDWFNKSNCDFGYQWITRAVRNPETNLIHGQGIRISDFILDATNRSLLSDHLPVL